MKAELLKVMGIDDPFAGYKADKSIDLHTWFTPSTYEKLEQHVKSARPSVVVEIGSWFGGSAILMAKAAREAKLDLCIICVDTWLGSFEHWEKNRDLLMIEHGSPNLYHAFMSNVIKAGVQDYVIPLRSTSTTAAQLLKSWGISPDFVFVDGDHEPKSVCSDLSNYYSLLKSGGTIVGDDVIWPSVVEGAKDFSKQCSVPVDFGQFYYTIKKDGMKVLCVCLTSKSLPHAVRCVESFYSQLFTPFEFDVKVFVNTPDPDYAALVKSKFVKGSVIVTECVGSPGKAKNDVIDWFVAHDEYTHLMLIDGDDFLYPVAFDRINYIIGHTGADVVGIQTNDNLTTVDRDIRKMQLGENLWLEGWFHEQPNGAAAIDYATIEDWINTPNKFMACMPNRLIICSRKACTQKLRLWYSEKTHMSDDVIADWCAMALNNLGLIKYVLAAVTSIYVYDSTIPGVVEQFSREGSWDTEHRVLREEIGFYMPFYDGRGFDKLEFITVPDDYDWQLKREFLLERIIK